MLEFVDIFTLIALIGLCWHGVSMFQWSRNWTQLNKTIKAGQIPVSIIIPAKNEEVHIPRLDQAFKQQTSPPVNWEVIFVNDGSDDQTAHLLNEICLENEHISMVSIEGMGKKAAISAGVRAAKYDWIISVDADVTFGPNFVSAWQGVLSGSTSNLILGSVYPTSQSQSFFDIEQIMLTGVAIGSALSGTPINASGANLAFNKHVFLELEEQMRGRNLASGDDIFLLHAMKANGNSVGVNLDVESIARTNSPESIATGFIQRLRWTSKFKSYRDADSWRFAIGSGLFYLAIPIAVLLDFNWRSLLLFMTLWLAKFLIDLPLFMRSASFSGQNRLLLKLLLGELIYFIYFPVLGVASLLYTPKWKAP